MDKNKEMFVVSRRDLIRIPGFFRREDLGKFVMDRRVYEFSPIGDGWFAVFYSEWNVYGEVKKNWNDRKKRDKNGIESLELIIGVCNALEEKEKE